MALKSNDLLELGIESIINYLRKSRQDEERERRTGDDVLKEQKEIMDRVLEPIGIPYDQETEVGSGDKISSRPVFQRVIDSLRKGKYQAIAVKEISRMGRGSYTDMGVIYDLIVEQRIFIITPYKLYDPRNPSDLRQIRFELFMSREEFETTRERLFGGRVNNAIAGRWVAGAAPFGFNYNKDTKKLEINETEAAVVRTLFDYYVNGVPTESGGRRDVSFRALATYLTRKTPLLTPKGLRNWSPMAIKRLIENERYIGTIKFRTTEMVNGKVVDRPEEEHIIAENAVPPIIDMETWEKSQAKLRDTSHKPRTKMDFSPCELAGLCICKVCGRRMVRQYSVQYYKKVDGSKNVYHKEFLWCTTPGCTFVKYRNIEEDLLEVLKYFSELDNELLTHQITSLLEERPRETTEDLTEYIEQRRRELKNRMKFIYDKYESEIYSDEMFLERKAEIDDELKKLDELGEKKSNMHHEHEAIEPVVIKNNLHTILDAYHSTDNKTERNNILRAVFDSVVIEVIEKGRGRIPAKHVIYPILKLNLLDQNIMA
ncbi:recombinase family protein [Paenibacillus alvei]|uniref:Recombinase family protein n=1 Tax=Paenibacillus alvei TaxID=44250 RepID=A0ABT4H8P0_PAEAL|nr:recombinase family protein [Paenibacillus alvei]MCY9764991.1 recombinase family protein [Paenibacillus alvei]MCY9769429.1 recombinase family protein [Paenibacillus alvei]